MFGRASLSRHHISFAIGVVVAILSMARMSQAAIVAPSDGATEFHYLFVTSDYKTPRQSLATTYPFYHDFATAQVALNPSLAAMAGE